MSRSLVAVFACALLVAASPARANGRFPQSNQIVFHPRDTRVISARTTFGLLVTRDGGATWSWVCEEALAFRPTEDPPILRMGDGSTLVSLFAGLHRGTPDDCSFTEPDATLGAAVVIDNCLDPSNVDRAYALTSSGGRENQPWRTDDDGQTWTPVGAPFEAPLLFETIEVAPSDSTRLYLTGAIPPTSTLPRQPFVFRSTDGGLNWERYPFALEASDTQRDKNIFVSAIDPVDPDRLYLRVSGDPDDRLLVSDDGGQSFREALRQPLLRGFARSDDGTTVYAGSDVRGLFRSDDRGETFAPVTGGIERVNCLAVRGDELWACGNDYVDGFTLGRSRDRGASFEPVLRFKFIAGVPECDADAPVTALCGPRYPELRAMFDPTGDVDAGVAGDGGAATDAGAVDAGRMGGRDAGARDAGPPAPKKDGGCAVVARGSDGSEAFAAGIAALLLLRVRARTRRRAPPPA
jgi:hypothetical protein